MLPVPMVPMAHQVTAPMVERPMAASEGMAAKEALAKAAGFLVWGPSA